MEQLETVKIEDGKDDYAVINKSDFDEKKHKLFKEKEVKEPKQEK